MKLKKSLALLLAGTLMFSMAIVASAEDSSSSSCSSSVSDNSSSSSSSEKEKLSPEEAKAAAEKAQYEAAVAAANVESQANALAAEEMGISMATLSAATEAGKSVGEFCNNAVTEMPGLEDVTPVAQGGGVIINGVPSNQSFTISKPVLAHVTSAKAQANALGGSVLNVVAVDGAVSFETASVNFYMPGITGTENIQVLQYTQGQWAPVAVKEIRADHVVVDITNYGVLAFVQVQ